jgi:hypothetical protein
MELAPAVVAIASTPRRRALASPGADQIFEVFNFANPVWDMRILLVN